MAKLIEAILNPLVNGIPKFGCTCTLLKNLLQNTILALVECWFCVVINFFFVYFWSGLCAMELHLNISMRKKQGKIYIAYLTERFGLVSYSYIIVHGVKLYNMGWDPFFHTFSSFLI